MHRRTLLLVTVMAVLLVALPTLAVAGPGGKIAAVVAKSFWGRVVLVALVIVFLPLILYVLVREWIGERRARRDLQRLRMAHPAFDWLSLKDRMTECFHRVHAAWRKEDMAQAQSWMTDWYWQNQQLVHLDRWAEEGLQNRCTVKSVDRIRALHVACRNEDSDMSGSRVVASISATMEDYLEERMTGKVVEGEHGFKQVETVWTFELGAGRWRVANIEEGALSLSYAQLANEVPERLPTRAVRSA